MNFAFTEEQEEFRRQVRRWLQQNSPSSFVRQQMESEDGFDRSHWVETAGLGWQSMAIPEEFGGAGFGYLELVVLFRGDGSGPLPGAVPVDCGPLLPRSIGDLGSSEQKQELLGAIAGWRLGGGGGDDRASRRLGSDGSLHPGRC